VHSIVRYLLIIYHAKIIIFDKTVGSMCTLIFDHLSTIESQVLSDCSVKIKISYFDSFISKKQQSDFCRKQLSILGCKDSAKQKFPSKFYSISHSKTFCVAAYSSNGTGCGIDVESTRAINPRLRNKLLNSIENKVIGEKLSTLSLWSIKEAAFKSDTYNAGKLLTNYKIFQIDNNCLYLRSEQKVFHAYIYKLLDKGVLAISTRIN